MIRQFSVLYVGQIELDHVGMDGTPADQRRYPNERLVEAYRTVVDVARCMDDLGYYCLWTAEHHFQREGYEVFPNLIMLGTYLAAVTRQLRLGCAFNILPMWHPLRLAEDYAVADILTGTRARWSPSAPPCSTRRPTGSCSRSSSS
jgi:alkanesulfonate monooxygenase SsuD/methylene tetrahydromethanopterin reductase-like flavin-dependent oxidoreductase (luciferase family)